MPKRMKRKTTDSLPEHVAKFLERRGTPEEKLTRALEKNTRELRRARGVDPLCRVATRTDSGEGDIPDVLETGAERFLISKVEGYWIFELNEKTSFSTKELIGFWYLEVLCTNPDREYSATDLRNLWQPGRSKATAETDRKTVDRSIVRALEELTVSPRIHLNTYLTRGKTCVYRPPVRE